MNDPEEHAADPRAKERKIVALVAGVLTCLLITVIAYLMLRPVPYDFRPPDPTSWFDNQPAFKRSLACGIESGCVVGLEFLIYTRLRPETGNRLAEAVMAGFLAFAISTSFCWVARWSIWPAGLQDHFMGGVKRWLEWRATQERMETAVLFVSGLMCGLQEAGHVYAWYGSDK